MKRQRTPLIGLPTLQVSRRPRRGANIKVPSLGGNDKNLIALIVNEVRDIAWQWAQSEAEQVVQQDMDAMERSVQALLRLLGGSVMGNLAEASVAHHGGTRPVCPHCGRPMRLVERQRGREMRGLVGDFAFARPYYQCRSCGGGIAPDDERLGIGTVSYTPALSRVAAMMVTEVPFERAAGNLSETLGAAFAEAEIYRVVEALGVVAEAEIKADMALPEAAPATPAGDTLLIGVDGTTSFIDGDWHEVKVGVVGLLGPELQHDVETGRELLKVSDPRYCAAVATEASAFFPRVASLARQAGFGHPGLRRVVCLGDGGRWIWNRTSLFRQDGVEHVEILDYMHASEHVRIPIKMATHSGNVRPLSPKKNGPRRGGRIRSGSC